jgi:hypothetical protein
LLVRATGHPVWNRACATAAGHAPEARAPPATRSTPWRLCCPCALTKNRLICSKPRPRSLSPLHTHHLSLYSAIELPRSSAPGADELPIQAGCCRPRVPRVTAEQILPSSERSDGRRAPCELPATAFHRREDVTGDSRVQPRNRCPSTTLSSGVAPQYSTTPPTPPDDPLTVVSPPPRCAAMDRSPGEPPSSPDPSNRAPTPPQSFPSGFPASPCRQRPESTTTVAGAPWGASSPASDAGCQAEQAEPQGQFGWPM